MMDKIETVRQFLVASGTPLLTALGGTYVQPDRMMPGYDNTHPAVFLIQETGGGHPTGADFTDVYMCKCFGGTANSSDARAIFRAVYDRFFLSAPQSLAAGDIKQVFYLSDFPGPDDPVTGWPNHIGRFQIVLEA